MVITERKIYVIDAVAWYFCPSPGRAPQKKKKKRAEKMGWKNARLLGHAEK